MVLEQYNINGKVVKLDRFLRQKLDNVKKIVRRNWDCVMLIDGVERSGKSNLGLSCGWYLTDGKMKVSDICIGADDVIKKIGNAKEGSLLMLDESSLVFYSKDSMKKEQKKLIKILNVVGQKNIIFIMILPSVFDLMKDIAVRRSKFLLHVYTGRHLERGRYSYFSEKKKRILYDKGKKNFGSYGFPQANFVGRFEKFNPFGQDYLDVKNKTLLHTLELDKIAIENPIKMRKAILMGVLKNLNEFEKTKKLKKIEKAVILGIKPASMTVYARDLREITRFKDKIVN